MKITKLEAARRQLETALHLYFFEGDPVSIHTLAAAAHGVLTEISRKTEGNNQMLFDLAVAWIKEEYRKDLRNAIRKAQNFFKHADKDHEEALEEFNMRQSEILMMDACFAYHRISGERPPLLVLFYVWARLTFGHEWLKYDLDGSNIFDKWDNPALVAELKASTRQSFYFQLFPLVHAWMFGDNTKS